MTDFITCPFCSGHENLTRKAIDTILTALLLYIREHPLDYETGCEIDNICNVILNTHQREQPADYTPPICPTPDKRKYSNREHAVPDAVKWKQYPYACACGFWHLSKQSASEHKAKIDSPAATADEFEDIDPLML